MRIPPKKSAFYLLLTVGIVFFVTLRTGAETVTNETILEYFGKSSRAKPEIGNAHDLMAQQSDDLVGLLRNFLEGDIKKAAENTAQLIKTIRSGYKLKFLNPENDTEGILLKGMLDTLNQAELMQAKVRENDFVGAYINYMLLINQCVKCHQRARPGGKLPELPQAIPQSFPQTAPAAPTAPVAPQSRS